jgi:hypothetical protein
MASSVCSTEAAAERLTYFSEMMNIRHALAGTVIAAVHGAG